MRSTECSTESRTSSAWATWKSEHRVGRETSLLPIASVSHSNGSLQVHRRCTSNPAHNPVTARERTFYTLESKVESTVWSPVHTVWNGKWHRTLRLEHFLISCSSPLFVQVRFTTFFISSLKSVALKFSTCLFGFFYELLKFAIKNGNIWQTFLWCFFRVFFSLFLFSRSFRSSW